VPEDKKSLLQLITNKKDVESIAPHFEEKVQKYFINIKEGEASDDGDSPSFILFTIRI